MALMFIKNIKNILRVYNIKFRILHISKAENKISAFIFIF